MKIILIPITHNISFCCRIVTNEVPGENSSSCLWRTCYESVSRGMGQESRWLQWHVSGGVAEVLDPCWGHEVRTNSSVQLHLLTLDCDVHRTEVVTYQGLPAIKLSLNKKTLKTILKKDTFTKVVLNKRIILLNSMYSK